MLHNGCRNCFGRAIRAAREEIRMKNVLATMAAAALLALSSCAGATEAPSVSENAPEPASTSADPADAVYAVYLLYAEAESSAGRVPATYEEWLSTITPEVGPNGN
ncbi:MAG: hypothetical protein IJS52_02460, partial [Bacilli bacterium]|nr:hypothetical protein [Bacilli bacterium]